MVLCRNALLVFHASDAYLLFILISSACNVTMSDAVMPALFVWLCKGSIRVDQVDMQHASSIYIKFTMKRLPSSTLDRQTMFSPDRWT